MNENMRLSPAGANLIKAFESCLRPIGGSKFTAYMDPVGVPTIGWGHTNHHGRKFRMGDVWTRAECDKEFASDMAKFENVVKQLVTVPLKQYQFDALVSFAFNCGDGNLAHSTLLRRVNARDFDGAAREFHKWNHGGGRVLSGLTRRRASEALLFQNIPDLNYDGKPDRVRPPTVAQANLFEPSDFMPQQVDPPPQVEDINPLSQSKTVWGGILQWLGGVGVSFVGMFSYIQTPWGLAAFVVIALLISIGLYLVVKGRIDVAKIVKSVTEG